MRERLEKEGMVQGSNWLPVIEVSFGTMKELVGDSEDFTPSVSMGSKISMADKTEVP